jgi:peptidoglycan biosynthesis protein MviN/MurJ (putative lipid II flippase)
LLTITVIGIIVKLVFNSLLVKDYQQDGLALSTSLSFVFFFSASYLVINRSLEITNRTLFIKEFCFYFINSCVCLLSTEILSNLLPDRDIITDIFTILFFIFIYLLNLILVNHKVFIILNQIFPRLNVNILMKKS